MEDRIWIGDILGGWRCCLLALAFLAAIASPAAAQSTNFTEIYNSGVLTLGPDESLQLTIVNNNNVSDPALPDLPASEESCTFVAQFLDGNGNVLQKQQQTLQPGQNFSFSQSGQTTVQARVDISPGAASGFAGAIAGQCVVTDAILNTSSSDAILFPPLTSGQIRGPTSTCQSGCAADCSRSCQTRRSSEFRCLEVCKKACKAACE